MSINQSSFRNFNKHNIYMKATLKIMVIAAYVGLAANTHAATTAVIEMSDSELAQVVGNTYCNNKRCFGDFSCPSPTGVCHYIPGGACMSATPACEGDQNKVSTKECLQMQRQGCSLRNTPDYYTTCTQRCREVTEPSDTTPGEIQLRCKCTNNEIGDPVQLSLNNC